jgi:hypothetical protein
MIRSINYILPSLSLAAKTIGRQTILQLLIQALKIEYWVSLRYYDTAIHISPKQLTCYPGAELFPNV